jgi:two-component system, OmpR family, sensor histidine kinase KdpD
MDKRPNPDELLKHIETTESKRGKLKIFFGAVAGVGKTYSMLEQAQHRKKENIDVVVGIAETHKRAETEILLEGLEILPRKISTYKNVEINEFDLESALKRQPALILVDELAHTNAPGSRHTKRWQDVDELLEAGINVYTTLNVQHCESLNDVIAQITQVIVKETVPDTFIEKADEIELVDIPPEELLKRLKEGKVYLGKQQAELASHNFFRLGNLIALRQLALKYTTKSVDTKLRAYKDLHDISTVWKVGEHFLVCISSNPKAAKIIRAAKQISIDLGAQWTVAYVESSSSITKVEYKENVNSMLRFAEKMGANTVTLNGEDVAETIVSYCRSKNISKIVMGKPGKPNLRERLFGSIIDKLSRICGEIDLYLISGETEEDLPKTQYLPMESFSWKGLVWAVVVVGICVLINKLLFSYLALANLIMVFLLGITWLAFSYGRRITIIATLLSVACFDFFFIPPLYTFSVMNREHIITFAVMFIVGIIIGTLTGRLRRQTIAIKIREQKTQVLYSLSQDLAKSSQPDELFQIFLSHVQDFFKYPSVIFTKHAHKELEILTATMNARELASKEFEVANWVYEHHKIAGKGTDTLSGSKGFYIPLTTSSEIVGVLGIFPRDSKDLLNPDNYHILEIFIQQTSLAIEGAMLAEENIKSEAELEKTRLKNMLFDTSTYDIKGALEIISKSSDELSKPEILNNNEKRNELIKTIQNQAEQLDDLIDELPKILEMI